MTKFFKIFLASGILVPILINFNKIEIGAILVTIWKINRDKDSKETSDVNAIKKNFQKFSGDYLPMQNSEKITSKRSSE